MTAPIHIISISVIGLAISFYSMSFDQRKLTYHQNLPKKLGIFAIELHDKCVGEITILENSKTKFVAQSKLRISYGANLSTAESQMNLTLAGNGVLQSALLKLDLPGMQLTAAGSNLKTTPTIINGHVFNTPFYHETTILSSMLIQDVNHSSRSISSSQSNYPLERILQLTIKQYLANISFVKPAKECANSINLDSFFEKFGTVTIPALESASQTTSIEIKGKDD